MARLSNREKAQLTSKVKHTVPAPAGPAVQPPRAYIEFASFAAHFDRSVKPVRFSGNHWKL